MAAVDCPMEGIGIKSEIRGLAISRGYAAPVDVGPALAVGNGNDRNGLFGARPVHGHSQALHLLRRSDVAAAQRSLLHKMCLRLDDHRRAVQPREEITDGGQVMKVGNNRQAS